MKGTIVAAIWAALLLLGHPAQATEQAAAQPEQESPSATVTAQRGQTEVLITGAKQWGATALGESYASGSKLKTGRRSYIEVGFDENNGFRIKGNTQVRVDKIFEAAEDESGHVIRLIELQVIDGEVNARLTRIPDDSRVDVTCPTAVAGATGTGFTFAFDRATARALVKVAEHRVLVRARDREDKSVTVNALEQVEVQSWKDGKITATGRGVLSEAVLGREFVERFRQQADEAKVSARATAPAPDDLVGTAARRAESEAAALDAARAALTAIMMRLAVSESITVADLLARDTPTAARVYEIINAAEPVGTEFASDDSCTVVVEASLAAIGQALERDLAATIASVREIGKEDYVRIFGAEALATTKRAAELDAKRRLAGKLNGSIIARGRTLHDESLRSRRVRTTVAGVVEGAIIEQEHYFSDGSIGLLMSCRLTEIVENFPDLVGDTFLSSPEPAVFTDFEDYRVMRTRLLSAVAPGGGGGKGAGGTQGDLAKALVKMLGLEGQVDADAADEDYGAFLASMGVAPPGGWHMRRFVDEELLAMILIQLLGLRKEVPDPGDPAQCIALLKERGLLLTNVRDLLGNSNLLTQTRDDTARPGLYQNNLSSTRGR
jgi:hypothetical protein